MIRILHIRKMNPIIRTVIYFFILLFMDEIIVSKLFHFLLGDTLEPPQGPLVAPGKPQQWSNNKQNSSLKNPRGMLFVHYKVWSRPSLHTSITR